MTALVQGCFIAVFLVLGLLWPRQAEDGIYNSDTLTNVMTGGVLFGLRVAVFAFVGFDLLRGGIDLSFISHPLAQLLFVFLLTDFLRYWLHRLHHRVPILWAFHRVHHSSRRLNATSGLRMHIIDFLQLSAIPILLFGVIFDVSSFHPFVFPTLGVGVGLFDAFQHANLRFPLTNPLTRSFNLLFNNPHFHSWHHTRDVDANGDGNYGQALTIWDRAFGSHVSQAEACQVLGLPESEDLDHTPWGLQLLKTSPKGSES